MAMTSLGQTSIQTDREDATAGVVRASYDSVVDAVTFWLVERPAAHVTEPANDFVSILFDLVTGNAIGVRIDNFLAFAVHRYPRLQILAGYLDLVPREPGDTELFAHRVVVNASEHNDEMARESRLILQRIVDETGGFDPDVFPKKRDRS